MSAESALKFLDRPRPATFSAAQTIQATGLAAHNWHLIEQVTVRLYSCGLNAAGVED